MNSNGGGDAAPDQASPEPAAALSAPVQATQEDAPMRAAQSSGHLQDRAARQEDVHTAATQPASPDDGAMDIAVVGAIAGAGLETTRVRGSRRTWVKNVDGTWREDKKQAAPRGLLDMTHLSGCEIAVVNVKPTPDSDTAWFDATCSEVQVASAALPTRRTSIQWGAARG